MGTQRPTPIPFPLSSSPGANSQESAGRLINCTAEPLGDPNAPTGPAPQIWRRQPGLTRFAATANSGYRGGLVVQNLSYETWANNASTVDSGGTVAIIGNLPGTKRVSIARNQNATPDVVAVDVDNGAYALTGVGAPSFYNGGANLPQPNSVCFQDGYFFFTIADCRCFASGINALTQNSQTFTTANAKADVTLLRAIPFAGLLWLFTTGHCEIYQDVAQPFPAFPYARLNVLEYGLVQHTAIAGWEVGFSELLWVAQDFGVYWAQASDAAPVKVSPPDLDRLIEDQIRAGNTIEAGCYSYSGKKFWHLSSPSWTWEFNLATRKWSERWSLNPTTGLYSRWRGTDGHPAFNKWIVGDQLSGNLHIIDRQALTEDGAALLFRIESGPVKDFPNPIRIARADFDFDNGVGVAVGNFVMTVKGAAAGTGGVVRLTVDRTTLARTNDIANVSSVGGTTEANGTFPITVVDDTHIELQGTLFSNAYTSGGTAVDVTSAPNAVAPVAAISCSKDGGQTWGNPLIRSLGQQGKTKFVRASVKSMGQSSASGDRWRIDVTDPVPVGFMGGTQSSNPREVGT